MPTVPRRTLTTSSPPVPQLIPGAEDLLDIPPRDAVDADAVDADAEIDDLDDLDNRAHPTAYAGVSITVGEYYSRYYR